jgi:CheY-like chemotaxis protein
MTEARATQFVFVTANLTDDEARDIASLGPTEVVRKPFRWTELAEAVERAMAAATARRAASAAAGSA